MVTLSIIVFVLMLFKCTCTSHDCVIHAHDVVGVLRCCMHAWNNDATE